MQVSVENASEISRKITINMPESVIQEQMATRYKSLVKEVKLKGYRPGKVPQKIVERMYGDDVRREVLADQLGKFFADAVKEYKLQPVEYPHFELEDAGNGIYSAEFEVYPEINLDGLSQINIARPKAVVGESDIDEMLVKLQEQRKTWKPVDRNSQSGDRLTINFSGIAEGENFTNGKIENFFVVIGSKQFVAGFEDNLIGLGAGEVKTFEVTFPDDYGDKKLAGKSVQFEIETVSVDEPELPEFDEDFFAEYGVEEGNLEVFRSHIKANMESELEKSLWNKAKSRVMDALYEKILITVPSLLIKREVHFLLDSYKEQLKNIDLNALASSDELQNNAKRRAALGLILTDIVRKNDIKLDSNKLSAAIDDISKNYENPKEVVTWYYSNRDQLDQIKQLVLEDQVIEWLLGQMVVSEEAITFNQAMSGSN